MFVDSKTSKLLRPCYLLKYTEFKFLDISFTHKLKLISLLRSPVGTSTVTIARLSFAFIVNRALSIGVSSYVLTMLSVIIV